MLVWVVVEEYLRVKMLPHSAKLNDQRPPYTDGQSAYRILQLKLGNLGNLETLETSETSEVLKSPEVQKLWKL